MFRRLFSHIGYSNLTIRFQGYNIFEKLNKYFFKRSGFKASGQLLSIAATTVIELKIHFLPKISQKIAVKFFRSSLSGSSLPTTAGEDWCIPERSTAPFPAY
jgi:hypothetical protein